MSETKKEMHNNDRKVLADFFKGKSFNDKLVADFCTRNKIPLTDAGSVEDFIYQENYDTRMGVVIPLILKELATLQYANEYISDQKRKEVSDFNDEISRNIAQIVEDEGIQYRELSLLQSLAGDVSQIFATSERRLSNMCATVLAEMAQETLGNPLTIKVLAEERAKIADRKAKKIEKEEPETPSLDVKEGVTKLYNLPHDVLEKKKCLIDIEENYGVLLRTYKDSEGGDVAVYSPYEKDGEVDTSKEGCADCQYLPEGEVKEGHDHSN